MSLKAEISHTFEPPNVWEVKEEIQFCKDKFFNNVILEKSPNSNFSIQKSQGM